MLGVGDTFIEEVGAGGGSSVGEGGWLGWGSGLCYGGYVGDGGHGSNNLCN